MIRVLPVRVRASVWLNLAIGLSMLTACQATRTPLMSPSDEAPGEISHGRELTFTPNNRGRGNNIYLFDLDTGQRVALTTDGKSSMPAFSYPWAIWKAGPRYSQGFEAVVYDLRDGRREVIAAPGGESGDPRLDGQWLYWIASRRRPLYIYDLVNKRMFLALTPPPGEKAAVLGAVIYGNRIVWGYTSDSSVVDPEIVLEWRTLP